MDPIYHAPATAAAMAGAAAAFLAALGPADRQLAAAAFEPEGTRRAWSYLPELTRPGLALGAMDGTQRQLAHELIIASTSMPGYAKVVGVIAMEHVRRATVARSSPQLVQLFDPGRYCVRIFGTPGGSSPWGWQLAGHHVSLNFTVAGEHVSGTPCMLGSVPDRYGTLSPLADDEEAGYRLAGSLTPAQRAVAVIYHRPPPDFATRLAPRIGEAELPDHVFEPEPDYWIDDAEREILGYLRHGPKGIPGSALDARQRDLLLALVAGFAGRLPDDVGAAALARAGQASDASVTFAWAGGTDAGQRHYYRVQAPGLLIEHDNTQGGGRHVHSVWRDPDNDFGDDLLAAHYRAEHAVRAAPADRRARAGGP